LLGNDKSVKVAIHSFFVDVYPSVFLRSCVFWKSLTKLATSIVLPLVKCFAMCLIKDTKGILFLDSSKTIGKSIPATLGVVSIPF